MIRIIGSHLPFSLYIIYSIDSNWSLHRPLAVGLVNQLRPDDSLYPITYLLVLVGLPLVVRLVCGSATAASAEAPLCVGVTSLRFYIVQDTARL